jgi:lipoprotein-releasing system permease protein
VNLPFYISRRYLFAKKSHNAINIITSISVSVVAVGTMALIIVLSVFNGLENLFTSMYNSYESDLQITPKNGKYINLKDFPIDQIQQFDGVINYAEIVEDMALLKYNNGSGTEDRQFVAKLKGVPPHYANMSGIDTMLVDGDFALETHKGGALGVAGLGVYNRLNLRLTNVFVPVYAYYPNRNQKGAVNAMNAMDAFRIESFHCSGIFSVQQEYDDQLVFVSIDFARQLMQLEDQATSIELEIEEASISDVQSAVKELLGEDFSVKNQQEQNETIFKILKSEKWSSFLILAFIILIATFNIVGSITVLILEKKKDINSLRNMGADLQMVKRIFLFEGMLITLLGSAIGLALGALFIVLQQQYGIIPMEGSFVVDSFPVALKTMDFIYVFALVMSIGFGATVIPVSRIAKNNLD